MELTARLAGDAQIKKTNNGRELVAFTVVENHRYKTKTGEKKVDATFYTCSYWLTTTIAAHLKKGMIVSLFGRVGINSFKKADGDFIAHLTFRASNIRIITSAGKGTDAVDAPTTNDDLPF